jgi:hypothetical protein
MFGKQSVQNLCRRYLSVLAEIEDSPDVPATYAVTLMQYADPTDVEGSELISIELW